MNRWAKMSEDLFDANTLNVVLPVQLVDVQLEWQPRALTTRSAGAADGDIPGPRNSRHLNEKWAVPSLKRRYRPRDAPREEGPEGDPDLPDLRRRGCRTVDSQFAAPQGGRLRAPVPAGRREPREFIGNATSGYGRPRSLARFPVPTGP